jgi:hypothetical protein
MAKNACECCGRVGKVYKIKGRSACLDCIQEFDIDVHGWGEVDA